MNIILLGAPGSGKGTQAATLQTELGLVHVASGDLFRYNLNNQTELGLLAKGYMDRGELVPDDVTVKMVGQRLQEPDIQQGVLLDGFPRTLPQAESLDTMLAELGQRIDGVIYLHVDEETLVERLSGRVICRKCQKPFHKLFNPFTTCPTNECEGEYLYQRDDDKEDTVRARIETYKKSTTPLIDAYTQRGLLTTVNGDQSMEAVTIALKAAVTALSA